MEFDMTYVMIRFMFTAMFLMAFGTVAVTLVRGIIQWFKNNNSPKLAVPATIVSKRTHVSRHRHKGANGIGHYRTSTSYYVTFQVESGDRMEFHVSGQEYGLLLEGDKGILHFQGTRYQGFDR